jgi:putative phosphoesterase
MRIGVVSDTHSRYRTVARALELLRERGVTMLLHCGDIDDTATVSLFRGLDAHFVFGNCDLERDALRLAMAEAGVKLHEPWGSLELAGRKLAFLHGDDTPLLRAVLQSGHYDYLFHGHTHVPRDERIGPTRVINPGALQRANPKRCIVLDLVSGEVEAVVVPSEAGA